MKCDLFFSQKGMGRGYDFCTYCECSEYEIILLLSTLYLVCLLYFVYRDYKIYFLKKQRSVKISKFRNCLEGRLKYFLATLRTIL